MNKIYLGKIGKESIYITKHSWDCDWYWSFGYLGNKDTHFHIKSLIEYSHITDIETIFNKTWLTQAQWWVIRDLFIQAYALQKAAKVYRYGGHQTTLEGTTNVIASDNMQVILNNDLRKLLDKAWEYLETIYNESLTANKGN